MAVLKKVNVDDPRRRREALPVPSLGKDAQLIVRTLSSGEYLEARSLLFMAAKARAAVPEGKDADSDLSTDSIRSYTQYSTTLLSLAVVDADDESLWTPKQWSDFEASGSAQAEDYSLLLQKAEEFNSHFVSPTEGPEKN